MDERSLCVTCRNLARYTLAVSRPWFIEWRRCNSRSSNLGSVQKSRISLKRSSNVYGTPATTICNRMRAHDAADEPFTSKGENKETTWYFAATLSKASVLEMFTAVSK